MTPPLFPFSAIVGQEPMRIALLINAVDSTIGGVLIRGHKGTAKSTAVRALARLLPSIDVVPGCAFHCDPDDTGAMHHECRQRASEGEALGRETIAMPLVELPLNATEDRLVGTLHVEHALRSGERRFEPGLLAAAHRAILYVDEVNLLDDHLVDMLLDAAASGYNRVEREGVSYGHPARFMLVGTMNPEEGELRPQFLDRFGLCVTAEGLASADEREAVLRRRMEFDEDPVQFAAQWAEADKMLADKIVAARQQLSSVRTSPDTLRQAVHLAVEAQAHGHRADIAMLKTARALAALVGHDEVGPAELHDAARYVLAHRMRSTPLFTPESSLDALDELLERVFEGDAAAQREQAEQRITGADSSGDDEDDDLPAAEAMQIPGAAAAGSILLVAEKKSPSSGSSEPTS